MKDLKLNQAVSVHYEKFFNKFKEIDNIECKKWDISHILGYFCKKYEDFYGIKYSFKFNNSAPSKSFEVFQM